MGESTSNAGASDVQSAPEGADAGTPPAVSSEAVSTSEAEASKLVSPKLAAAVAAETRAARARKAMLAERETFTREVKAEREAMQRERAQWQEQQARDRQEYEREFSTARKLRENPSLVAEELANAGDPVYQMSQKLARLEAAEEQRQAEGKRAQEARLRADQDRAIGAQVEQIAALVDGHAACPNVSLLTDKQIRAGVDRLLRSGQYSDIESLAARLESDATEFIGALDAKRAKRSPGTVSATAQEQQQPGNGTHAAKPNGSSKALTGDLSAETTTSPQPKSQAERWAEVKAGVARQTARK